MSMVERDYVLRMIQQLAQAFARIAGLKRAGQLDDALEDLTATADAVLGPLRRTLDAIDAQSAAGLLADTERIEAYAALTAEEAAIRKLMGEGPRAAACERRAICLYLESTIMRGRSGEGRDAAITTLRRTVDEASLPARYRQALATLQGDTPYKTATGTPET